MSKYNFLLSIVLALHGCATKNYQADYSPQENDTKLELSSEDLKRSPGILMFNEREITIEVFFTDSGCPSFEKGKKGYIGSYKLNNFDQNHKEIRIPPQKNIFLKTRSTWTGVGYSCNQALVFRSEEPQYFFDLKLMRRHLGDDACIPHQLFSKNSDHKSADKTLKRLPLKYGFMGDIEVDQEHCGKIVASI